MKDAKRRRTDFVTRLKVDNVILFDKTLGRKAALEYAVEQKLPLEITHRVLLKPSERRK